VKEFASRRMGLLGVMEVWRFGGVAFRGCSKQQVLD
jgi:hypothetical protein